MELKIDLSNVPKASGLSEDSVLTPDESTVETPLIPTTDGQPDVPSEVPSDFRSDYLDFTEKITAKDLRGTKCDPEEAIMVIIYDQRSKKSHRQLLKRRKLVGKTVVYEGTDGLRHVGKILGFHIETGFPALFCKDEVSPKSDADLLVVKE